MKELCRARTLLSLLMAASASLPYQEALAATIEEAIANCRMTVGRPIVMACMQRLGRGPENLEKCRATSVPTVQRCVRDAIGGPAVAERPPASKRARAEDKTKRAKPIAVNTVTRGAISDIAPLPQDENRVPIELRDLEVLNVSAKTSHENTVKLRDGSIYVAHVTDRLKIKVVSNDSIEVEREQKHFDKNDNPIGSPVAGTLIFKLGKEESVRGNEVVWKFEGSTLFYQVSLAEGAFRTVVPIYRQGDTIKCVVMSGFARENGTSPVRTIGAAGSIVEVMSSRRLSSSCDVSKR